MVDIFPMGKAELSELGLSFVSIPVPAFPVYDETYVVKTYWFLDKDMIVEQCSSLDPFIVFDYTGVYEETKREMEEKGIPKEIVSQGSGYIIRAVVDLPQDKWQSVISNIIEVDRVNYNFEWDLSCYKNEKVQKKLQEKAKKEEELRLKDKEVILKSVSK